jgi:hypothetical protein
MTLYEMGITRWKKMWSLWVETVENIFSWRKMSNLRLFFKYRIIEYIDVDCSILWNVLDHIKNKLMWGFGKVQEQWVGMVRGLYLEAIWQSFLSCKISPLNSSFQSLIMSMPLVLNKGWTTNYMFRLKKLLER